MLVCQILDDKRIFRFREHFPDVPASRDERRTGGGFENQEEDELFHDDVVPTPRMLLSYIARLKEELDAHSSSFEPLPL